MSSFIVTISGVKKSLLVLFLVILHNQLIFYFMFDGFDENADIICQSENQSV